MPEAIPEPSVASNLFGNKEQITTTEFGLPAVTANPTQPNLVSEGKLFDNLAVGSGATVASKSVKIAGKPSQSTLKSLYVQSDHAGTFVVQVLLDESEVSGGEAVWRTLNPGAPIVLSAGVLYNADILSLFRQMRILLTNGGAAAVVNAWVFSIP
jgi:hypothetical protein